jgi:hypothetical protein
MSAINGSANGVWLASLRVPLVAPEGAKDCLAQASHANVGW